MQKVGTHFVYVGLVTQAADTIQKSVNVSLIFLTN